MESSGHEKIKIRYYRIMETENIKKRGRPRTKDGKRVTFYLSFECIKKLKDMTVMSRNASVLIENLINQHYIKNK